MNEPHPGPPDNVDVPPASDPYATNQQPAATPWQPPQPPARPYPPTQQSGPPAFGQPSGPPASGQPWPAPEPGGHYPQQQPYAPGQATPSYGAPSYGASYGQPDQTQYQPPAYGAAPYSYVPPAKGGSSTTKILLIVLAIVVVIGGLVGGALVFVPWSNSANSTAHRAAVTTPSQVAPSTGATTTPTPTSSATAGGANTIFKLPKTAAGLTLAPSSGLGDIMSNSLPDALAGETTTGLYMAANDPSRLLILIGTQTSVGAPQVAVAGAFAGMSTTSTVKLGSAKTYSAGSMGGAMKCASGHLSELGTQIPVGVCVVADSHGLIITIFTSRSASSAASATRALRPSFEHI